MATKYLLIKSKFVHLVQYVHVVHKNCACRIFGVNSCGHRRLGGHSRHSIF